MAQLAQDIHNEAVARIPAAPVTDPADLMDGPDLLAIFAKVEAAIAVLELLTRGARILRTAGVPDDAADGEDGDLAINLATTDLYAKDAGHWQGLFKLKGDKGDNVKGDPGLSAYAVALANGFVGTEPQWLASLGKKGDAGLSAYQVAKANGFAGTVTQWLESLKGGPGDTGQRGNVNRWEAYQPTNEDGLVGDLWIHSISATKCAFYKCTASANGVGTWSLRYTSPDAAAAPVGSGSNYTLPQATAGVLGGIKLGTGLTYDAATDRVNATATATFPAQTVATAGQYLMSTGTPGQEVWAGMKRGWQLYFLNAEMTKPQRYFRATTLYRIQKDNGVATLSYAINGAAAVAVSFSADVWTGSLQIPALGSVVWTITYQSGQNEGNVELLGNELTTP